MTIYVDLVLLINFIIDLFILIGVSLLLKRNVPIKKLILGALIGSLSTITLFYINNNTYILIYKILTSILMLIVSFGYLNFNYFKDNIIWLYILSITLGGGIYLLSNGVSLSNKGLVFYDNGLRINLIVLIIISPLIIYLYINKSKSYRVEYSNYYDVYIYYKDNVIKGTGFLDTGNNLKDPYFHKPIVLVDKSLIKEHVKTFLVPYYTINNKDFLDAFKPSKIVVNNKVVKNVLIGLTNVNINGIKIILNKEIL